MAVLSDLQTEVAEEIGSINATDDATKINRALNRGVRDILRRTHCYVTSMTLTPGATADYTLTSSVLSIVAIDSADSLERVPVQEILRLRNQSTSSSPARKYALAGATTLMWWPTPAATDTMTVYYVPAPTAMSSASHDPSSITYGGIPEDYHELIARYAMARLASFDDDASSAQGARYREEYEKGLKEMKAQLVRRGGVRLGRAVLGRRTTVPHNNSTDY